MLLLYEILLLILRLSRSATIEGPKNVNGYVGGSVTVTCNYDVGYEKIGKWWSRGPTNSSLRNLVETTGREKEVRSNRVILKDIQREHRFNVTMEKLRLDDTDTYWCGIKLPGPDQVFQVAVDVDTVPTTMITATTPATTTTTMSMMTTITAPVTPEETPEETNLEETQKRPHPRKDTSSIIMGPAFKTKGISVPLILSIIPAVLILSLLVLALIAWRNRQRTGKSQ